MKELPPGPRCPRCIQQGWPENCGSPPECAFPRGWFEKENWNCATMNILRTQAERTTAYTSDDRVAVLSMPAQDDKDSGFILLAWYKNRGRTDLAILFEPMAKGGPRLSPLKLEDVETRLAVHKPGIPE